jgi:exonuclease III
VHGRRTSLVFIQRVEDDRILQTVVGWITIVNTYLPQGYKINSDKYAFKLQWFENLLCPKRWSKIASQIVVT